MPNKILHLLLLITLTTLAYGQEKQAIPPSQWDTKIATARQLWKDGQKDATFSALLELEAQEKELPEDIKCLTYNILARKLRAVGELQSALEYKKKAYKTNPQRHAIPNIDSDNLALFYKAVNQYDAAIHYTKLAVSRYSTGTTRKDSSHHLLMHNNIGFYYYLKGDLDSAMVFYKKVVTDYNLKHFPGKYGLAIGNMGQIYFEKGDFQAALKLSKKDAEISKKYELKSYLNALLYVARYNYQLNQLEEAEMSIDTFFLNRDARTHIEKVKEAYELKAEIHEKLNKLPEAQKALYQALHLADSLRKKQEEDVQAVSSFSSYRLQSIRQQLELAKAKEAKKSAQAKLYIALSIFGFLIILSCFYYYRLMHQRKEKLKQLEHELLQSALENKRKDLTQLGLQLSNKREFIDKTNGLLKEILQKPAAESQKNIQSLIHEFNHRAALDENLAALWTDIEKVNNSFFENLGNEFPALTRTEKEICGLLILNFSTKDIAHIRNVTTNAVKKKRQIIRKKLPITPEENLVDFLLKHSKPKS